MGEHSEAGYVTEADIRRAMEILRDGEDRLRLAEAEAYIGFMNTVPEAFKDHPEIQTIATIVMHSQRNPLHPSHAEKLRRRYEQIVNGEG